MMEAIQLLQQALFLHIKGDPTALKTANQGLRLLQRTLHRSASKELLAFAIDRYETIKEKRPLDAALKLDFLTSNVAGFLLLPLAPVPMPGAELWDQDVWEDAAFPRQPGWQRIGSIDAIKLKNPTLEMIVPGEKLRQANSNNCSLVCALMSADWGSLIYPRDANGPVYTPSGHYAVKLLLGGVWRIVEVDDWVPYSDNLVVQTLHGSLAPILIEKAYLKVFGGYHFEGSNAALISYRLSGWIPFVYDLQNYYITFPDFPPEQVYAAMLDTHQKGRGRFCLGTGINAGELQKKHDFVITDLNESGVQVLNPWNEQPRSYTWPEITRSFKLLYVNECPESFVFKKRFSELFQVKCSFEDGLYHMPQYCVENLTDATVRGYVLAVIKPGPSRVSASTQIRAYHAHGEPILTPDQCPVLKETPEMDTPCLSIWLELEPGDRLTVLCVIREAITELSSICLNFEFFFSGAVSARKVPRPLVSETRGAWTIGGAYGSPAYFYNPAYQLCIKEPCSLSLSINAHNLPCQAALFVGTAAYDNLITTTGPYASGNQSLKVHNIQPGNYIVIPSLFEHQRASFVLTCGQELVPLPSVVGGYFETQCVGRVRLSGHGAVEGYTFESSRPNSSVEQLNFTDSLELNFASQTDIYTKVPLRVEIL